MLKIKGKEKCIALGDKNTSFFYSRDTILNRRNNIVGLYDSDNNWIEGRDLLSRYLTNHFEQLLTTSNATIDHNIVNLIPTIITAANNANLLLNPSMEEIKSALFGMPPNASPGPDGFPACFFQKN